MYSSPPSKRTTHRWGIQDFRETSNLSPDKIMASHPRERWKRRRLCNDQAQNLKLLQGLSLFSLTDFEEKGKMDGNKLTTTLPTASQQCLLRKNRLFSSFFLPFRNALLDVLIFTIIYNRDSQLSVIRAEKNRSSQLFWNKTKPFTLSTLFILLFRFYSLKYKME